MTKATPESSDSLVFECDFEEPPAKVWRALTEPRLLEAWLATDDAARTDSATEQAEGGGQVAPRQPQPTRYEIVTADPHRLLRYRWRDRESGTGDSLDHEVHSVVTVELAPGRDGGTHLRLTHGEFTIVSTAPLMTAVRVTPITSARRARRRPVATASLAAQCSWRRAA